MLPPEEFIGKKVLDEYMVDGFICSDEHMQIFSAYRDIGPQRYRYNIYRTYISSEHDSVENVTRKYADITKKLSIMNRLQGAGGNMVSYIKYKVTGHIDPFAYEIITVTELLTPFIKYMEANDITVLEILKLGVEISNALGVCHAAGITHNNITKENIYVDQNGSFVLGDMDVSKESDKKNDIIMLGGLLCVLYANIKSPLLDEQIAKAESGLVSPKEFGELLMKLMLSLPVSLLHSPIKVKEVEKSIKEVQSDKKPNILLKIVTAVFSLMFLIFILVDVTGNETVIPETTTVQMISLVSIGQIWGELKIGSILYAGEVKPSDARVLYQWQRSYASGEYEDVPGAVYSEYIITKTDEGAVIRLVVSGAGVYEGSVISEPVKIEIDDVREFTAQGEITGEPEVGSRLYAGSILPSDADVIYQWQSADDILGSFEDIPEESKAHYNVRQQEAGMYIRVVIKGKGEYSGKEVILPAVYVYADEAEKFITSIGAVSGVARSGGALIAGSTDPEEAQVSYQWQRGSSRDGVYTDIPGADGARYTLKSADQGRYIRVYVQGTGEYSGSAMSKPVYIQTSQTQTPVQRISLISFGEISGTPRVGNVLTAGSIIPVNAKVTYQWMSSPTKGGTYTNIPGATLRTFIPGQKDAWRYIRVMVRGTGSYMGTLMSEPTSSVQMPRIAVGMHVRFGTYNGEPILWRCVGKYGATVTLQAVDILTIKSYDSAKSGVFGTGDGYINMYGNNVWSESNIRQWLNSKDHNVFYTTQAPVAKAIMRGYNEYAGEKGFLAGFNTKELGMILPVRHGNVTDLVYLLSEGEIRSYLGDSPGNRIRSVTQQAKEASEFNIGTHDGVWSYWTRTAHPSFPSFVRAVGSDGGFYDFVSASGMIGILPALTLKDDVTLYGKGSKSDPYRYE